MIECDHTITVGNNCTKCGIQVFEVEERTCGECKQFKKTGEVLGTCMDKYMGVTSGMHVTYKVEKGTCFKVR